MSRGLGVRQVEIKIVLNYLWRKKLPTRFADIAAYVFAVHDGNAEEGDELAPAFERSMRRALQTLIARGEVIVVFGGGSSRNPRHFLTVEAFAALSGRKPRDTAHAKEIAAGAGKFAPEIVMAARLEAAARSRRAARR